MAASETLSAALQDALRHVGQALSIPLRVVLWDGSEVAMSADEALPTLAIRSPGVVASLLKRPSLENLVRHYAVGNIAIDGDLMAIGNSLSARVRKKDVRRLSKRLLLRKLWPFLFVRAEKATTRHDYGEGATAHANVRNQDYIQFHYDVGNDFYALLLGASMVYSCAYFDEPTMSLDDAQLAKLDLVCRKLSLAPGMRMLDVGCGWGSLAIHAAREFGVQVVGVTISTEQAALARTRVAAAGLADLVEIRLQDYREVVDGPYDAISSVGMAEHVGLEQLPRYSSILHDLLVPGGRLLNHAIARGPAAGVDKPHPKSFLARYVFPDGELQPLATHVGMLETAGFEVRDVEVLREHYALTCRAWVHNLEQHWDEAVAATSPGRARVWRLYLAGSALGFEQLRVGVNQVLAVKAGGSSTSSWLRRPAWGRGPTGR